MAEYKGSSGRTLLPTLCFMSFGVVVFYNQLDRFNYYNIGFGILIGLIFGFLFTRFLRSFLSIFNGPIKKEHGKKIIKLAVGNGMLFLTPFAIMALVSTIFLRWSMTSGFISAGIMAVGTASSIELGKIKGKQELKNTIVTSAMSYLFSFIWTLSMANPLVRKIPGIIEGLVNIIPSLFKGGGGL